MYVSLAKNTSITGQAVRIGTFHHLELLRFADLSRLWIRNHVELRRLLLMTTIPYVAL